MCLFSSFSRFFIDGISFATLIFEIFSLIYIIIGTLALGYRLRRQIKKSRPRCASVVFNVIKHQLEFFYLLTLSICIDLYSLDNLFIIINIRLNTSNIFFFYLDELKTYYDSYHSATFKHLNSKYLGKWNLKCLYHDTW